MDGIAILARILARLFLQEPNEDTTAATVSKMKEVSQLQPGLGHPDKAGKKRRRIKG